METVARIILEILLPGSQLIILVITAILLFWFDYREWGKRVTVLFFALFLLYSTPFLPEYLAYQLERQYPVWHPDQQEIDPEELVPVMVLTAGVTPDTTLRAIHQLNHSTFPRLVEGVRVYHELKSSGLDTRLVLSGSASANVPVTQAQVQAVAAEELGANPNDLVLHDPPGIINTCKEAKVFSEQFGEGHKVIVSTTALHIPRSMWWFRHHGLKPTAAPAHFRVRKNSYKREFRWKPSYHNISLLETVIKERIGMVWAQVSGC